MNTENRWRETTIEDESEELRYHPMLDPVFQVWMSDEFICSQFLEALLDIKINIQEIRAE